MEPKEMIALDTKTMPWKERYQEALGQVNVSQALAPRSGYGHDDPHGAVPGRFPEQVALPPLRPRPVRVGRHVVHPSRRAQGQLNLLFGGVCKIDQRLNMEIGEWHPCKIRYFCEGESHHTHARLWCRSSRGSVQIPQSEHYSQIRRSAGDGISRWSANDCWVR